MSLDATNWAWRQRGLRPSQKLVLLSLSDRAGEAHTCHPSIRRLVLDTGLDRKTVITVLQELQTEALIRPTGRMAGYNNLVPEYQLVGVCGREDVQPETEGHQSQKRGYHQSQKRNSSGSGTVPKTEGHQSQKRDHHQSQKRDTESPIKPPIRTYQPDGGVDGEISGQGSGQGSGEEGSHVLLHDQPLEFAEVREMYDRLVRPESPGAGLREFWALRKARVWPGIERLLQGIEAWLRTEQWQREAGRYRPGLARFLAERMWLADPAAIGAAMGAAVETLPRMDDVRRYWERYGTDGVRSYCQSSGLDAEEYLAVLAGSAAAAGGGARA